MAARVFDIYNLNSPMVTPTAPAPQASTAAAPQVPTATRGSARLMRFSAYLLTFACVLFLAALIVTVTPLGAIDADITVPFVAVVLGGLAAIVWDVARR